jgi:hypothetical protein
MFDAKIEKGKLILTFPLSQPEVSRGGTGKMAMIATTHGFVPTTLQYEGKPLKLSLMCGYTLPKTDPK